jgi:hypothetical protein
VLAHAFTGAFRTLYRIGSGDYPTSTEHAFHGGLLMSQC